MPASKRSKKITRHRIEVFLSHSSKDRRFARKLAAVLQANGLAVWYSETHIQGATQWQDEIGKGLQRCNWFLVILTPNAVKSKWVKFELQYALNDSRYDGRIVPVYRRNCNFKKLAWPLGGFELIDFKSSFEAGCRHLLGIWRKSGK